MNPGGEFNATTGYTYADTVKKKVKKKIDFYFLLDVGFDANVRVDSQIVRINTSS